MFITENKFKKLTVKLGCNTICFNSVLTTLETTYHYHGAVAVVQQRLILMIQIYRSFVLLIHLYFV